jgi:hypothetical protein
MILCVCVCVKSFSRRGVSHVFTHKVLVLRSKLCHLKDKDETSFAILIEKEGNKMKV